MRSTIGLLFSFGLGAGLMYMLDPDKGRRRRSIARGRATHLANSTKRQLSKTTKDFNNRARGVYAEAGSIFSKPEVSDEKLDAQIRSKIGRLTSHPHAIKTKVENGKLTIGGPILESEATGLLKNISSVYGINEIENNLETHMPEEKFPALINGKQRPENKDRNPEGRAFAAAAGGGLAFYGAKRRDMFGSVLGSAGLGLLARSMANKPLNSLVNGENGIHVRKTINIAAPVDEVFRLSSHPENFPEFMSHVREVEKIGDKQFRWKVDGVPGMPMTWETQVTDVRPNERIAWQSIDGANVRQIGTMRFEKVDDKNTRLSVEMDYSPPAGIFGHAVAGIFRRDPKSEMDDDLLRMKSFLERGKVPRDAAARLRMKGNKAMKVREIMTADPACCTPENNLHEVARLMAEKDCGAIPIVENFENRKPVGIVTDRDITIRAVAKGLNPLDLTARDVMTYKAFTVTPETSVDDCCKLMEKEQVRRMLVVDDQGRCCGIVAQADVARNAPVFETAELVKDVSLAANAA